MKLSKLCAIILISIVFIILKTGFRIEPGYGFGIFDKYFILLKEL